jgi:murein DD-endopeptidase MepM/ murein hydrolase activator NlpD
MITFLDSGWDGVRASAVSRGTGGAFRPLASFLPSGASAGAGSGSGFNDVLQTAIAEGKDIPVRALCEAFGNSVDWDKDTRTIKITSHPAPGVTIEKTLTEGVDFYIGSGNRAYYYNGVRPILESQGFTVTFTKERKIEVTTGTGASVMTLEEGKGFYIGKEDEKAHFMIGVVPPGGERPGSTPAQTATPQTKPQETPVQSDTEYPFSTQHPNSHGFILPVEPNTRISDTFDTRGHKHRGVDFDGKIGDPIYAVADGKVLKVDNSYNSKEARGAFVYIDHGNGTRTVYQHNSKNFVNKGDNVYQGQVIALLGNSGGVIAGPGSDGSHLHFEMLLDVPKDQYLDNIPWSEVAKDKYAVDPLEYLK